MKWKDKENGPLCYCGMPTFVSVASDGQTDLVCIFHDKEAGALFPLPQDKRPDNWPDLTNDEIDSLMLEGQNEYDARKPDNDEEDEHSVPPRTLN